MLHIQTANQLNIHPAVIYNDYSSGLQGGRVHPGQVSCLETNSYSHIPTRKGRLNLDRYNEYGDEYGEEKEGVMIQSILYIIS